MAPDIFGGAAALLYLLYLWRQLRTQDIDKFPNRRVAALVIPAIGLHLIYAVLLVQAGTTLLLSVWSSAVLVTLVASIGTFYLYLVQGYRVLALVIVPLAIISLCCGLLLTPAAGITIAQSGVIAHVVISILAYATLALAAIQAASIIALHQSLKKHESTSFVKLMPPLQTVEATDMYLLWLGVSLLTLAIATGFVVKWDLVQTGYYWLHMSLALACWCLYLGLICGKLWFGWRGQISAQLSLLAFAVLLIGYFGLKFVFGFGT